MHKPKIETMLPSEAKKAIEEYFYAKMLERLEARGDLAGYNAITQRRDHTDLLGEFDYIEYGSWVNEIKQVCFDNAEKQIEQDFPKVTGIRNLVQVDSEHHSTGYSYTFEAEINDEWVEYGPDVQGNYTIRRDCPGHTLPEFSSLYRERCTRTIAIGFYALDDLYNEMS